MTHKRITAARKKNHAKQPLSIVLQTLLGTLVSNFRHNHSEIDGSKTLTLCSKDSCEVCQRARIRTLQNIHCDCPCSKHENKKDCTCKTTPKNSGFSFTKIITNI